MNDEPTTQAPQLTPGPATLAEIELRKLGIGSPTVSMNVPLKVGEHAASAGRLTITDPEGAPVAELAVETRASADAGIHNDAVTLTGRATPASEPSDDQPHGPYSWLRLGPDDVRFDGASAIVGHDPVDTYALESVDPGRAVLLVVLDGPRATPGPAAPVVVRSALALRDELRREDREAAVVLVPAPQYGDERDGRTADEIAHAFGANRAQPDRQPDLPALRAGLDGVADLPAEEWPLPSLQAWRHWRPPRTERGLVMLFTGLSGSGKSTVARAVVDRLNESAGRTVTLLDGDLVRRNLSAGLGFSREDRDRNVERIGFVAAEIARHGGVAVCAPIAPFAATRARVRAMAEADGDFVLVHVATPLEECERRDRKGLYARARAGEIPDFTGISSPYEEPDDADLVLDTSHMPLAAARDAVLDLLSAGGRIGARSHSGRA